MRQIILRALLGLVLASGGLTALAATYRYYGPHVTNQTPWINTIVVYNNGALAGSFEITVWDEAGAVWHQQEYLVPATASLGMVMSNDPGHIPDPEEIPLVPVEGTFVIDTDNPRLRPKLAFRYGDGESLCEFFLQDTLAWEYILPNTIHDHFSWTGMSLMNPSDGPLTVWVEAFRNGVMVGQSEIADIPPGTKYVRLSDGFWPGLGYADYDQVRITSWLQAFPPPMSITGNDDQDRHVFFNAAVTAETNPTGSLYATDSIVGDLMFVPPGTFVQGRGPDDPCDNFNEVPFTHTRTHRIAVMATEVTRQMWADLQSAQPDLPADPTQTAFGGGMDHPVQSVTWHEAVLYANLLSELRGLTPCYYTDAAFTTMLDTSNYQTDTVFCLWNADGYRLLSEGEWEYACRAGTTTPFSVDEPAFIFCGSYCTPGVLPDLEQAAVFCANNDAGTGPAGQKMANPWNLHDMHGNVWEWCWDWHSSYYPSGAVSDYVGPSVNMTVREIRGGAWSYPATSCRSASRGAVQPNKRSTDGGFRLCRTVDPDR